MDLGIFTYPLVADSYQAFRATIFQLEQRSMLDDGCPACPRPDEKGEHYWALDGNFRLFRYKNASRINFPPRFQNVFGSMDTSQFQKVVWAYHLSHLISILTHKTTKSTSTSSRIKSDCHLFKATDVNLARNRASFLEERGVFAVCCARHGYPLLCVDMFTGERYEYADYCLTTLFKKFPNADKYNIFYDVACQYRKKFNVCPFFNWLVRYYPILNLTHVNDRIEW